MATCSVPDDHTSVCSVCLEPYKERNPKILPCLHTFCLPCLKDLEIHHLALEDRKLCDDDEGQRRSLTFPCPTCRAEITVPPGGVTQFQSNFYLTEKTLKCEVCKRDEEATYSCTDCGHMCTQCKTFQYIFTSNHQVQQLVSSNKQHSQISHNTDFEQKRDNQKADNLSKQIHNKMTTTRQKHAMIVTQVLTHGQPTLLSDDDFEYYQQQSRRGRQVKTLLHQYNDSAIDLQAVESYIGTVCDDQLTAVETSLPVASDVSSGTMTDMSDYKPATSQTSDITKLTRDISDIEDKLAVLDALTQNLESQNQTNVSFLKDADFKLQQNVAACQQNMDDCTRNISNIQNDIVSMRQEFETMKVSNSTLQNDVDITKQESSSNKMEIQKVKDVANDLRTELKTFKEKSSIMVAFNARLHEEKRLWFTARSDILVLSDVTCNVGQAYNKETVIFIAPVTGIYFFMARAMSTKGVCLEPYKGRNPKLLPCFHTLCLPCLKDLEQHSLQALSDTKGSQDEDRDHPPLTFPCPTCRAVITVPTGGVIQLQTNFYFNNDTLTCQICDLGNEASYNCSECSQNMCDHCKRCHNKFLPGHKVQPLTSSCQQTSQISFEPVKEGTITQQLAVLEAALVTMREEEDTLERERQAVTDVITRRADAMRALVTQAEEKSQRTVTEKADNLRKQIQNKMTTARKKHAMIVTQVFTHGQPTLLSDDDFEYYQHQCRRRQVKTLLHQFNDFAIDMQPVEAYIGTVCDDQLTALETSLPVASDVSSGAMADMSDDKLVTSQPSDITKLTHDIPDIEDELAALDARTKSLQSENKTNVSFLKDEDFKLQQNVAAFQQSMDDCTRKISNIENDIASMRQEFETIKVSNSTLQNDVDIINMNLRTIKWKPKKGKMSLRT